MPDMGIMTWLRARFDAPAQRQFSVDVPWARLPTDQLLNHWASKRTALDREQALTVPAVLRGRNMICSIGTLPLEAVDARNVVQDHPMLRQIDANVPNVVTLSMTVEDLLFEGVAWWKVTSFGWDGKPASASRYAPDTVSLQAPKDYRKAYLPSGLPTEGVVWMDGEAVPWSNVIRFDSPNPPLLTSGSRAIRRALALDDAAIMYASDPRPMDYFTPADPSADPIPDEDVRGILAKWKASRRERSTAYVPAALRYNEVQQPTPADLQLVELQKRVTKEIANALGVDPEDLGESTTSRTYQNATDRRKDRVNDTLAPYMKAITDRLAMPDVTKRGVTVRFNLDDYLKADPKTRAEVAQTYVTMGVMTTDYVARVEGLPPEAVPTAPPAAALPAAARRPIPATVGEPVQAIEAAAAAEHTFDRVAGFTFDTPHTETFAVDVDARTIVGLAVPWGQAATSKGRSFRFARGSIKYAAVNRVKLLRDHDNAQAIGKAVRLEDTDAGLVATFKVSPGRAGDEALALAADGVLDGLSIGVDFTSEHFSRDPKFPNTALVAQAALREVSLTAVPSFDDSRLTSVTLSDERTGMNKCPTCGADLTPGVAHTCPTPAAAPVADNAPVTFSGDQFAQFMARFQPTGAAAEPPEDDPRPVVNPTARPVPNAQVTEPLPYRFSRQAGRTVFAADQPHDFSSDLFAVIRAGVGDGGSGVEAAAARQRLDAVISEAFSARSTTAMFADVESADVTALNPNRHRPDLWQPQMDYATPLWDMVDAGTTDGSKFDVPKFTSAAGLVGPATEKVEPASGSFVAELQTITPTQVWGKVEITRQSWRAGGNPALSGILWDQMLREYYEDREAAVATFLATLTAATDITLTGRPAATPDNDDDQVTVGDFSTALTDLQFVRGGNRFRAFAVHQDLYRLFGRVTDDAGRKLFPMLAPSNANGTTAPLYRTIDIDGVTAVPSWALGAGGQTTATNSWLFDPAVVRGWASAPERMFWDFGATVQTANIPQLSFVTLGIYGDVAFANINIAGVRQVIFDPSV
jgi:HK97 family phage prohead protease